MEIKDVKLGDFKISDFIFNIKRIIDDAENYDVACENVKKYLNSFEIE